MCQGMADLPLSIRFKFAAQDALENKDRLDVGNWEKLRLYGLYMQATEGDAQGDRPPFWHPIERLMRRAWDKCVGMESEDAMQAFVDKMDALRQQIEEA